MNFVKGNDLNIVIYQDARFTKYGYSAQLCWCPSESPCWIISTLVIPTIMLGSKPQHNNNFVGKTFPIGHYSILVLCFRDK
jgi:hypothetical protein